MIGEERIHNENHMKNEEMRGRRRDSGRGGAKLGRRGEERRGAEERRRDDRRG